MSAAKGKKGFTLIELLVVIAIIAILAAILFPVFARAKRIATITQCLNNMKQWGAAMILYEDSHSGRFPYAASWGTAGQRNHPGLTGAWFDSLKKYTSGSRGLRICPLAAANVTQKGYLSWAGSSYAYYCNHVDSGRSCNDMDLCGRATSDVKKPSRKPCLYEIYPWHGPAYDFSMVRDVNFVFCDGHAASLRRRVEDWVALLTYSCDGTRLTTFRKTPWKGFPDPTPGIDE